MPWNVFLLKNWRMETGRRTPVQNRRDCWESPRLLCPDYVWADESFTTCQRLIRSLSKHPFPQGDVDNLAPSVVSPSSTTGTASSAMGPSYERNAGLLLQLVQDDLPVRLYQFRCAMDAESVVTKRFYLFKCEYRAHNFNNQPPRRRQSQINHHFLKNTSS
jgi:hypothetical protein